MVHLCSPAYPRISGGCHSLSHSVRTLLAIVLGEDLVHRRRAVLDHGPDLEPVHGLSGRGVGVAYQAGDLLNRDVGVIEERAEPVPHLARRPTCWAGARTRQRLAESAPHGVLVELVPGRGAEDQDDPPALDRARVPQRTKRLDSSLRQGETPPGLLGLRVATGTDGTPHVDRELLVAPSSLGHWYPRLTLFVISHHVIPAEPPHFFRSRTGQQRRHDVGMHRRAVVPAHHLLPLLPLHPLPPPAGPP